MAASFSLLALSASAHVWGLLFLALNPQNTMMFLSSSSSGSTP